MATYKLREGQLGNRKFTVILERDGSSLLTALVNYVFLFAVDEDSLGSVLLKNKAKDLEQNAMIALLKRQLLVASLAKREDNVFKDLDVLRQKKNQINLLPSLATKISPNHSFKSTTDFNMRDEIELVRSLDIPLHHAWVLNPKDIRTLEEIGNRNYDELVAANDSIGGLAKKFINDTHGLTEHGLCCLFEEMKDESFCILYRNNGFEVIVKHDGYLNTLVTDEAFSTSNSKAMWKTVNHIPENEIYLTSEFIPIPNQENAAAVKTWYQKKEKEILSSEDTKPRMLSKSQKKKMRDREKKKRDVGAQTSLNNQPPVDEMPAADVPDVHSMIDVPHVDSMPVKDAFLEFLRSFKDFTNEVPYYKGQVEALREYKNLKLNVQYAHIEKYDKMLAWDIRDNFARYILNN